MKKIYYSISEVSKMINVQEHTIRFWDSKLPELSKRSKKGKTRFFNLKQIDTLSKIKDILKKEDTLSMAFALVSKKNIKIKPQSFNDKVIIKPDSFNKYDKIKKINTISEKLKNLINY